ncbi:protein halfway [Agrilus planipennis]|uniref:Protein halfway n=1 Tax=Agrilus planipennis TaxID=224129 RepID=A0A7F5RLB8_AGRPL|nr:protein halfway [Agrilus planipennis]
MGFLYRFIIFNLILAPFSWGRLNEEDSLTSIDLRRGSQCFHEPPESCPSPEDRCRCKPLHKHAVVCCNVNPFLLTEGLACANVTTNGLVTELHIRNATLEVLNVSLPTWKRLRSLSITDGRINRVAGEFGKLSHVSCLNLSSNSIAEFEDRALVNLYNLSILDLSYNNLSDVPRFRKEGFLTLDISENKPLLCTNLYDTFKKTDIRFNNKNNTFCLSSRTFHWFNSTEQVPFNQVETIHKVREECGNNCTCEPVRLQIIIGKPPAFAVFVNCSNMHLTSLPTPLPPNTVGLNVSNNNITSLELISEDPTYENLRELFADNNQITSIVPLEGTKFLSSFQALSLRNNQVKSLPLYILTNIFDRNDNNHFINLGLNRIHCDCNTAKVLKVSSCILFHHHHHDHKVVSPKTGWTRTSTSSL